MTSSSAVTHRLEVEKLALAKELALLTGIKRLATGEAALDENPEALAKAIRSGFAIPLKYTQSMKSLASVYTWAVKDGDADMVRWLGRQITQALGPDALRAIPEAVGRVRTDRQRFLDQYRTIKGAGVPALVQSLDGNSFWTRQVKRIAQANYERCNFENIDPLTCDLLPLSHMLKSRFVAEPGMPGGSQFRPLSLIEKAKVSGYVAVPALIAAHAPRMNWQGFLRHKYIERKTFKKPVIPLDLVLTLLATYNAPQYVVDEATRLFR